MGEAVIWGALALGVIGLIAHFSRRGAPETGVGPSRRDMHPYHCVAIEAPPTCCLAARKVQGQRFLADEAPSLPLAGCTALQCTCVYAHFDDRRHRVRRDPYVYKPHDRHEPPADRRASHGRRRTDVQYHPVL
ncbi:MAG: hypothetical protein J0M28_05445 [Thauera sp.]|nr:hypothetical protein [Thauera sp.]